MSTSADFAKRCVFTSEVWVYICAQQENNQNIFVFLDSALYSRLILMNSVQLLWCIVWWLCCAGASLIPHSQLYSSLPPSLMSFLISHGAGHVLTASSFLEIRREWWRSSCLQEFILCSYSRGQSFKNNLSKIRPQTQRACGDHSSMRQITVLLTLHIATVIFYIIKISLVCLCTNIGK